MPNLMKKRKLQRPKYSLAKQLESTSDTAIDLDAVASDKEEKETGSSTSLKEQSEVTYLTNDYLTGIEGVSLSIQEDTDGDCKSSEGQKTENLNLETKPEADTIKKELQTKPLEIDTISKNENSDNNKDDKPSEPSKMTAKDEFDLDMIIAELQSVVPTSDETDSKTTNKPDKEIPDVRLKTKEEESYRPAKITKPKRTTKPIPKAKPQKDKNKPDEYDRTKNAASASELSALIDYIVCDMDAFVQDPYADSGLPKDKTTQPDASAYQDIKDFANEEQDEGYDTGKVESHREDYDIYARVDKKKRRFDSTPNLYQVYAPNQELDTSNEQYEFHSLRYPKNRADFYSVSPEKKSVSFNNVVFEVHHPRYRVNSSDMSLDADATLRKTIPSDELMTDEKQRLISGEEIDTGHDRNNFVSSTSISTLHDETNAKTRIYESVTSLSDDAISMPSEDELYTSGNETETEEESKKSEEKKETFMPRKVRKLIKCRTIFLILTWFTMGMVSLLPSSSLRTPVVTFTDIWEPQLEMLLSKGAGFFLGVCIGGLSSWLLPSSLEVSVISALLMLAGSLAARPWCVTSLLMCASHAVQGTGRGIATIASHMFLHRLWRSDKVFLVLHCLFIAFATGASVVPPLTFTVHMNANKLVTRLHTVMVEEWMFSTNGHQFNSSGIIATTQAQEYGVIDMTTVADLYSDDIKQHVVMTFLQIGLAVVPFILALVFIGFAMYTCLGTCRNRIKKYRYRKKMENYRLLKEKLTNSIPDSKVFPNLNGNPGENTSEDSTKEKHINGGKMSNGKIPSETKDKSKLEDDKNSKDGSTNSSEDKDVNDKDETQSNGHVNHVTHVVNSKPKKLAFKLPQHDETKFKAPKKKQTWLLNDQKCGITTLLYLYVFFSLAAALECILVFFLYSYAINTLHFSEFRAILLLTLFLICFAFSRILSMVISRILPPNALVVGCLALSVMSSIIFVVYGGHVEKILWLFLGLLGACIGPILPGGLTWANIYLNLNYKSLSLAYWLMALGMTIFGTFAGALLKFVDSQAVLWLVVAICAFSFLLFLPTMPYIRAAKVLKLTSRSKADQVISDAKRTYV